MWCSRCCLRALAGGARDLGEAGEADRAWRHLRETLEIPAVPLIFGQKKIVGSLIGNRSDFKEMLAFSARHDIAARVKVLPLSQAAEAIETVRSSRLGHRIVLAIEGK